MPRAKQMFPRAILHMRAIGLPVPPTSFPFVYFSKVSYVCPSLCILVSIRRVTEPFAVVDDCSVL